MNKKEVTKGLKVAIRFSEIILNNTRLYTCEQMFKLGLAYANMEYYTRLKDNELNLTAYEQSELDNFYELLNSINSEMKGVFDRIYTFESKLF